MTMSSYHIVRTEQWKKHENMRHIIELEQNNSVQGKEAAKKSAHAASSSKRKRNEDPNKIAGNDEIHQEYIIMNQPSEKLMVR